MTFTVPNILLIDSYDSFTNNLAALIRLAIPRCRVFIIQNDHFPTITDLLPFINQFNAIVVGPGPGSPNNRQDIGIVKELWHLADEHLLPIFGVCLGLQSLCLEYGAKVLRLGIVKHGQVSAITHSDSDIFRGVTNPTFAVRYHSLHASLDLNGDLEPLAWADDGVENGQVLMAVRHKSRPFWAVQYHPESVRTDSGGFAVMVNFWRQAQQWNADRKSSNILPPASVFGQPWASSHPPSRNEPVFSNAAVSCTVLQLSHLNMAALCEAFGARDEYSPFVLLDSASSPGRYSILGCLSAESLRISYHLNDSSVQVVKGGSTSLFKLERDDIWSWLSRFMKAHKVSSGPADSPFWGGLVGTLSYEVGVQTNLVANVPRGAHPDVNLVFVERSIVADAQLNRVYIQSLVENDDSWISDTVAKLSSLPTSSSPTITLPKSTFLLPDKQLYLNRIDQAMRHLHAGDSYELCLTAQTRITTAPHSSWERYKAVRRKNPAPFSAYLRLHPMTLVSTSPERFLSFSRPPDSKCQLRPIKGTVWKTEGMTRSIAEKALAGSVKEVAENLMIVDLIRHDLHGIVGADVSVTQFCGVEEYETVFQMVSVIEGRLPAGSPHDQLGWQVLKRSLPPGSMTGAPKKRSVEILQTLEDDPRGIYSGVFGYWCVSGSGDWAVTIRSCVKLDTQATGETWAVGAGGAITSLSDAEAEWDEMLVKLQSVLRSF